MNTETTFAEVLSFAEVGGTLELQVKKISDGQVLFADLSQIYLWEAMILPVHQAAPRGIFYFFLYH